MNDDKMKRVASIMAARYVNINHSACISDDDDDPSWVISHCVSLIDKEVSGFRAEFIIHQRKYRDIIEGFTPQMMTDAAEMFAEKA
jgi:hypothetical protein